MPRKASQPYVIAEFYVKEVKQRMWLPSDGKVVMAHAKALLKDYPIEDIMGCLKAIRDEVIEGVFLPSLSYLRHGEPPLIERWFEYKRTPPPIYMTTLYANWQQRVAEAQPPVKEPEYVTDNLPFG